MTPECRFSILESMWQRKSVSSTDGPRKRLHVLSSNPSTRPYALAELGHGSKLGWFLTGAALAPVPLLSDGRQRTFFLSFRCPALLDGVSHYCFFSLTPP